MKVRLTDRWIYIIAVINAIILIIKYGVDIEIDTASYIAAWENSWSKGIIDVFRTPMYPIFLGTLRSVFGNHFMLVAIIVQHIVFLISIYYFKQLLSWNVNSHTVVQWITLVYALLPATSTWANSILTESFAISGIVFLFYNLFSCIRNKKISHALWVTFWLFILIMLRPAFLYLFPALIIAWLFVLKNNKKLAIIGIAGVSFVGCIEYGYCNLFKERYGLFNVSSVSINNQLWMAFQNNLMAPSYTDNNDYKKDIEDFYRNIEGKPNDGELINFTRSLRQKYDITTLNNSIKTSQKSLRREWIKTTIFRLGYSLSEPLLPAWAGSITIKNIFALDMNILYLFLIFYLVLFIHSTTSVS